MKSIISKINNLWAGNSCFALVMPIRLKHLLLFAGSFCLLSAGPVSALDVVVTNIGETTTDKRILFKNELLRMVMEQTREEFGDYRIEKTPMRMNVMRAFLELEKGDNLSLSFAYTRKSLEKRITPIRIPVRRGLISYRLLMVNKGDEHKYSHVKTAEDLKAFTVGVSPGWATYKVLEQAKFRLVDTTEYNALFRMLARNRFDYIPRSVNEVWAELGQFQHLGKGLAIEPNLAIYIPSANYIFVSPKQPRIYQRIKAGLNKLVENGGLAELNNKFYQSNIDRAKLDSRRIIAIKNKNLPDTVPFERAELWFRPPPVASVGQ